MWVWNDEKCKIKSEIKRDYTLETIDGCFEFFDFDC